MDKTTLLEMYKNQRRNMANTIDAIGHDTVIRVLQTYEPAQAREQLVQKRDINLRNLAAHKKTEYQDKEVALLVYLAMKRRVKLYTKVIAQLEQISAGDVDHENSQPR